MAQIPIVVPLIVVGLLVGSAIKSRSPRISKRKLVSASLAAGLLNSIHAYLLYLLTPTQLPARVTSIPAIGPTALEGLAQTSEVSFVVASFLAGFLVVLLVLGVAMAYARVGKRGEELGEAAEEPFEVEASSTPG